MFQSSTEELEDRQVWGQVGTCSLKGPIDGWEYGNILPAGNCPAGWLEKLRQVGKAPRVLNHYRGPREWDVPPGGWSLTTWSSLSNTRLCS